MRVHRRTRRLIGGLLTVFAGVAVLAPGSPAQADHTPEPGPVVGPLYEVALKPYKAVKVKAGLCQGSIYLGGFLQTAAYFTPAAGCRSTAIQFWWLKNDNSAHWSYEAKGKNSEGIWTSEWTVAPDKVLRVVVTVVDSAGTTSRIWANTPAL